MKPINILFDEHDLARIDKQAEKQTRKRAVMARVLILKGLEFFEKGKI